MHGKPLAAARLAAPAKPGAGALIGGGATSRAAAEPPLLLSPRAILRSLFSFEALLVLYMYAGIYKSDPRFSWLPANATGLFFALSVLVGSFIIVRNPVRKKTLPVVFAMVCLVAWWWVTLMWSPSRIYGPDKVFQMTTLALWALIAGALIIAPSPERLRRLFTMMILLALWGAVDAVMVYFQTGGAYRYVTIEGEELGGHLVLGRVCGPGALVALAGWLYARSRAARWLCLGLFLLLCFVLAIGGGRGPLLSTVFPLLIAIGLGIRLTPREIRYWRTLLSVLVLLLIAAGGLALYAATTGQRLPTFDRLQRVAEHNTRAQFYIQWAEVWPEAPLVGHGAGSWPLLVGRPDQQNYPHNMFLELSVESGVVGLILFFAVVGVALRPASLERLRSDPQALCAMMLFANVLLNAMTTGDLPGNRAVFMMLGVLGLFAVRPLASARARAPRHPTAPLDLSAERQQHAHDRFR
jgi:O-antigen ligase